MGRYTVFLVVLFLTGCGAKGFHVVRVGGEPHRVERLKDNVRAVCTKTYSTFSKDTLTEYYAGCGVYLVYPSERIR